MTILPLLLILIGQHPTGPVASYTEYRQDAGGARQVVAQCHYLDGKPVERSEYVYYTTPRTEALKLNRRIIYGPGDYTRSHYLRSMTDAPFIDTQDSVPVILSDGSNLGYRICRDPWDGQPGETLAWRLIGRYGNVEIEHELGPTWMLVSTARRELSDSGRVIAETITDKAGRVVWDVVYTYLDDSRGNWTRQDARDISRALVRTMEREIRYADQPTAGAKE